ncbi:MAG: tRNA pseudouridine synthase A [Rhodospirillaceae bacterium]|nr:MAG: tRNA pseudouridine synthase A [Rhodospirillaceae bacterium]
MQGAVIDAFREFTGETLTVHASGRTDAGVHALGQVIHVDIDGDRFDANRIREALNGCLRPHPIAALEVIEVDDAFHARFECTGRAYRYIIVNRRPGLALERDRAWLVRSPLDADAMNEAAQALVGHHDFTSFRAILCQAKTPVKTLDTLRVWRTGERVIVETAARSFLHNQVRNMVGTLVEVGAGRKPVAWVREVLEARDRQVSGPKAPACGLYFMRASYPAKYRWSSDA